MFLTAQSCNNDCLFREFAYSLEKNNVLIKINKSINQITEVDQVRKRFEPKQSDLNKQLRTQFKHKHWISRTIQGQFKSMITIMNVPGDPSNRPSGPGASFESHNYTMMNIQTRWWYMIQLHFDYLWRNRIVWTLCRCCCCCCCWLQKKKLEINF